MADTYGDTYSTRTITAFFDTRDDAQSAIDRLKGLGLADGTVKLVRGDDDGVTNRDDSKGFWESLSDFFFPDDDRAAYAEGLRRGGFLVTASDIPSDKYTEALDILDDEGSVDVDARSAEWRSEGWSGTTGIANTSGTTSAVGYAVSGTGVSASDYAPAETADKNAAAGETDLGGTAAVGGYSSATYTGDRASYDDDNARRASDTASSWATSAENTAREAADKVSDWANSAENKVSDWASSAENKMSSDADRRDRNALADEAVTSSTAPVTSDAARMDSDYGTASDRSSASDRMRVGRRDNDLGRTRVRSYTMEDAIATDGGSMGSVSDSARSTEVEIEDDRNAGRREGTSGTRLSDTDR